MGFYDLRNPETRKEQAVLAAEYGIEGFAYYHYWFKGKRLLEKPFNDVLNSGEPDFPFCLIWANETWSRRWLGEEKEILIKQEYSPEDDIAHAYYLAKAFRDKRYIRINERPVFTIYRPNDLPDISATINTIKSIALKENGVEPFLVASNSHAMLDNAPLLQKGFDGIFNFRPQLGVLPNAFTDGFDKRRLINNVRKHKVFSGDYKIYDYKTALSLMQEVEPKSFDNIIPGVFVGWDNTSRRGTNGIIIKNNDPAGFEEELMRVKKKLEQAGSNLGLIFVNAWNEWAEGNYLEPDNKNHYAYLEAIKKVTGK